MKGFLFDAEAAMARIRAAPASRLGAAVLAVPAVERRAKLVEPQEPQEPQSGRASPGAPIPMRQPQEQQQPRRSAGTIAEADLIEERAAIVSETCPAPYVDTFARLNHQKPFATLVMDWERAVDDGGLFLDAWGALAAELQWTGGDLFDVPRDRGAGGVVWQLKGERVEAIGHDHVRLSDGRTIDRTEMKGQAPRPLAVS
jgi:hypothetical protein